MKSVSFFFSTFSLWIVSGNCYSYSYTFNYSCHDQNEEIRENGQGLHCLLEVASWPKVWKIAFLHVKIFAIFFSKIRFPFSEKNCLRLFSHLYFIRFRSHNNFIRKPIRRSVPFVQSRHFLWHLSSFVFETLLCFRVKICLGTDNKISIVLKEEITKIKAKEELKSLKTKRNWST